jgi:hypothetical protein
MVFSRNADLSRQFRDVVKIRSEPQGDKRRASGCESGLSLQS